MAYIVLYFNYNYRQAHTLLFKYSAYLHCAKMKVTRRILIKFYKANKTLKNSDSNTFNDTEMFKTLANIAFILKLNPLKDT